MSTCLENDYSSVQINHSNKHLGYIANDKSIFIGEINNSGKCGSGLLYEQSDKPNEVFKWKDETILVTDNRYLGEFTNDSKNGYGIRMNYDPSGVYFGTFVNDLSHGVGIEYYSEGYYSGQFEENKLTGTGTFFWYYKSDPSKSKKYVGCQVDDTKHGYGELYFWDGSSYVGEWKNDEYSGYGTYTYPNGCKYFGKFKSSMQQGSGTFIWANGDMHTGKWNRDIPVKFAQFYNPKIKEAIDNGKCTKAVELKYEYGFVTIYHCLDCDTEVCLTCKSTCHKKHKMERYAANWNVCNCKEDN